jgi:methylisocitrate lyase
MLYSTTTAHTKRVNLRAALDRPGILRSPGVLTPLSAKLIERHGFDAIYISGSVLAADLGLPDIGLTTMSEVANRARQITRVTNLPAIVDADTGFGEPLNVARTVQELEDAGVAALHIEDQQNPKRCGHLDGKQIVDTATATRRIRAAIKARRDPELVVIARTDIRSVDGFAATIRRARELQDAGADLIFPEALVDLHEFEALRKAISVPLLANMTEFGKSKLFTADQLHDVGVDLVIYPVSLQRIAMGAMDRALAEIHANGTTEPLLNQMQSRADLYELLGYADYAGMDESIYTFDLQNNY